jgi:ABC-type Fe3+ transport system substrate-binding protein
VIETVGSMPDEGHEPGELRVAPTIAIAIDSIFNITELMKQEGKPVASHFSTVDATPIWPLTGAIFKKAPHPNAARLFMKWLLEPEQQASTGTWSARRVS